MNKTKEEYITIVSSLILIVLFGCSLTVGQYNISLDEILSLILNREVDSLTKSVFFNLRLPRSLMALLAGLGLSLAGAIYQIIFHNPLASPDIIGVSSGANLGAAIFITIFSQQAIPLTLGAFFGGLLAVFSVLLLVRGAKRTSTSTYVLAGIVISSAAKTGIMILKYFSDSESKLAAIEYWTMGSFAAITAKKLLFVLPSFLIGTLGLLMLRRQIQMLSLSDDEARSLGVDLRLIRFIILVLSTMLVASIVSVTGLISFIGLIAPHISFLLLKRKNNSYLLLSMIIGGILMVSSDMLCRTVTTSELPISILTTIMGLPIIVYLMLKSNGMNK